MRKESVKMDEVTKEKVNKMTKRISEIYENTVGNDFAQLKNVLAYQTELCQLKDELETIYNNLNEQLAKLYDSGANEIDFEVNQLQREMQRLNNWIEDIVPDLLLHIENLIQELGPLEENEIIPDFSKEIVEPRKRRRS